MSLWWLLGASAGFTSASTIRSATNQISDPILMIKPPGIERDIQPRHLLICGLHRSGTSILRKTISIPQEVSSFENTDAPHNEGQHLQTVFPTDRAFGGPGEFAFHKEAALDENSSLLSEENRVKLSREWSEHWDLTKPILVEKSPTNLIRTRFLQAVFPQSVFVVIIRNPIAVALATQRWSDASVARLIEHWLTAYRIFLTDRQHLRHCIFFSYEKMVADPQEVFSCIGNILGIEINRFHFLRDENLKYRARWKTRSLTEHVRRVNLFRKYERPVRGFGYSLMDWDRYPGSVEISPWLTQ
jgi:hypothetical protein